MFDCWYYLIMLYVSRYCHRAIVYKSYVYLYLYLYLYFYLLLYIILELMQLRLNRRKLSLHWSMPMTLPFVASLFVMRRRKTCRSWFNTCARLNFKLTRYRYVKVYIIYEYMYKYIYMYEYIYGYVYESMRVCMHLYCECILIDNPIYICMNIF